MKILIVDDETDIRESLAEFFGDAGFEVELAANGAEAWERLSSADPPRAVILDLAMPVLDGNALYRKMREDPRLSDVLVIIATSDPGRAPPDVPTMTKPIDLERLLAAVKRHFEASSP